MLWLKLIANAKLTAIFFEPAAYTELTIIQACFNMLAFIQRDGEREREIMEAVISLYSLFSSNL